MTKIAIDVCQGMICHMMGSGALLTLPERLPDAWRDRVSIRGVPCLERCRERYTRAPFARVDGRIVERATAGGLFALIRETMETQGVAGRSQ